MSLIMFKHIKEAPKLKYQILICWLQMKKKKEKSFLISPRNLEFTFNSIWVECQIQVSLKYRHVSSGDLADRVQELKCLRGGTRNGILWGVPSEDPD